jgi:type I restriction enzyme R subunit
MSNFQFLKDNWSGLYSKLRKAEERVYTEPMSSASYGRIVLEECIHRIYELEHLEKPFNQELVNLINDEEVKSIIPYKLQEGLYYVRKTGNQSVHYGSKVTHKEALISLKYLFQFVKWFVATYSTVIIETPEHFNEAIVPKVGEQQRKIQQIQEEQQRIHEELLAQIRKLEQEREQVLSKAQESERSLEEYKQEVDKAREELKLQKAQRSVKVATEYTEAETRTHLIDIDLLEAGWHSFKDGRDTEFPVVGMPITADNPKGNGYVDYVLWDDVNNKPLAIIEAKKASRDLEQGRTQARLYADCLEKMYNYRPVIFYSNGYETKIWEDTIYSAPRRIHGFYTKDELRWLYQKRNTLLDIRKAKINQDIAGRPYQTLAIKSVAEAFVTDGTDGKLMGKKRKALLVMATGSGKTRTAAALVDVLLKNNWVKRVLFLADRNALVRQAKNSFGEQLPDLSSIDLTQEKEALDTRLVFSTYPTMMNKIDNLKHEDERFYGVGHFDLIIVDEAHRSIYNRYKAIFEYFDALVVGLTATPKDAIDHNTFELFGCSNEDPTFMYELAEAVEQKHLVPYKNINIATDFLKDGIKYSQLTPQQRAKYEETFEDKTTGLFPEQISSNALNKWLFNKDTVLKVLDTLMQYGLKIEGGDKLGRTIIFAANQDHAKYIVDCFTEAYPQYPAGFIAMIHNEVSHAQSLIDSFCDKYKENNPQIAVSVDMMDTGVDAVRVLNLVFFKSVRSYAKFWQMIGRGTRLCPGVFGPGQDKECFLIIDAGGNFDFFEVNINGLENKAAKPVTQQIFEARVNLSRMLMEDGEASNIELATSLLDKVHADVLKLDKQRRQVKMQLKLVDEFSARERWNRIDSTDVNSIEQHLSELMVPETVNEMARRFDLMMLKMQIATIMMSASQRQFQNNLIDIAEGLSTKYTIPAVQRSQPLIEGMRNPDFYKGISLKKLEEIREEIRELVQYLDITNKPKVYTNLQDSEVTMVMNDPIFQVSQGIPYRKRVESFIRENSTHITISKIRSNVPITAEELQVLENMLFDGEERGTKEAFQKEYGEQPLGKFIRSILGLETDAAQKAFSEFLNSGSLSANQITFIQNIISYLTHNGTIDPVMLFDTPPFSNYNGVNGVFDDADTTRIISIVEGINENAQVG